MNKKPNNISNAPKGVPTNRPDKAKPGSNSMPKYENPPVPPKKK